MSGDPEVGCVFCRIASGSDPSTTLLYEDDKFVAFKDIKPATDHHYLVITKAHIKNLKELSNTDSDVELVTSLQRIGGQVLEEAGAPLDDTRFGFHWPPFNTVGHLHLHAMAPISKFSLKNRAIFKPNSYWFGTTVEVLAWLKKLPK